MSFEREKPERKKQSPALNNPNIRRSVGTQETRGKLSLFIAFQRKEANAALPTHAKPLQTTPHTAPAIAAAAAKPAPRMYASMRTETGGRGMEMTETFLSPLLFFVFFFLSYSFHFPARISIAMWEKRKKKRKHSLSQCLPLPQAFSRYSSHLIIILSESMPRCTGHSTDWLTWVVRKPN